MRSYDVFFFSVVAGSVGIVLASLGFGFSVAMALALLGVGVGIGAWAWYGTPRALWFAGISVFIVFGSAYYRWDDARFRNVSVPYREEVSFVGEVVREPERRGAYAKAVLRVPEFGNARIQVTIPAYPEVAYGDTLWVTGSIEAPAPPWDRYLEKERIRGTIGFPKVEVLATDSGSFIMRGLYGIRSGFVSALYRALPADIAALGAGLLVGDTSGLSEAFTAAMKASGTTHLTALSGYNIAVVTSLVGFVFAAFLGRRARFFATLGVVFGFVALAGAEASVVRAAIMASVLLLAGQVGRAYDPRNAVAFAGFLMVLANPKVLLFDLGFQLSFLALLGIVYVRPAILGWFGFRREEFSFKSWFVETLAATVAAQLAVAPVISLSLGTVSILSFVPNLALAPLVPVAMGFAFAAGLAALLSGFLGSVVGLLAYPVLWFPVKIIEIAGRYSWTVPYVAGVPVAAVYYALLAWGTRLGLRRNQKGYAVAEPFFR